MWRRKQSAGEGKMSATKIRSLWKSAPGLLGNFSVTFRFRPIKKTYLPASLEKISGDS